MPTYRDEVRRGTKSSHPGTRRHSGSSRDHLLSIGAAGPGKGVPRPAEVEATHAVG